MEEMEEGEQTMMVETEEMKEKAVEKETIQMNLRVA